MRYFYTCSAALLFSLFTFHSQSQTTATIASDTLQSKRFLTIINFNREQTYASFGSGLGNQVPLIFEASFSPTYFISSNKEKWALMMNPQVQMRMLDKKSWPIQVPSYHFYVTYFRSIGWWRKTFLKKLTYTDAIWFSSIVHHSNGQSGKFYLNDTTRIVDLASGNFSVNYLQFGILVYTLKNTGKQYFSLREIKLNTDIYPASWCDPNLVDIYWLSRLFGTLGLGGPWREEKRDWMNRWLQNSSMEIKGGWIFGNFRDYAALDVSHRMIIDITYKYYPPWLDELSFFLRFYTGQDYYNVYFEKQLTTVTVGITTNTIKISNSLRYLGNK